MATNLEKSRNPNTPPETLCKLAKDKNEYVRLGVAGNTNTPQHILGRLTKDKTVVIQRAAYENPNCPMELKVEYILSS